MSKDLNRLSAGKFYRTDDKIKVMKTKRRARIHESNQTLFLKELFGKKWVQM